MLQISDSQNIAVLDTKITADLCQGKFYINIDPSTWITGIGSILGIKYEILNPYGVAVRSFGNDYDALPFEFNIPTQAGAYQAGKYTISIKLFDAGGAEYTDTKTVNICAPNTLDKTKKFGSVGARLTGVCKEGRVYVMVDNVPAYNSTLSISTTQSFQLDYPTAALPPETTTLGNFSVKLFEGAYKIVGEICATYNFGDNIFVKVLYKVDYSKAIICSLDECCVFEGLQQLNDKMNSDCSEAEKKVTRNTIDTVSVLLDLIDYGARCGDDISEYIESLEKVLTVSCGCRFNNGTPITNDLPSGDFLVQGCNVTTSSAGLTTIFTVENYEYKVQIPSNGGALIAFEPELVGCVKTQVLIFDIQKVYAQIKGKANADYISWGAIIMKNLLGMDASCLGLDAGQLAALSYKSFMQILVNKICEGSSTCKGSIGSVTPTQMGPDVMLYWVGGGSGTFSFDVYVDDVLKANTLAYMYLLTGYADSFQHTYRIIPRCSNGAMGTVAQGVFNFAACPTINPPVVSSTNVTAQCPFDLTGLVNPLPFSIYAEWHKSNDTLRASRVSSPESVSDGTYYVFATNSARCYSTGVRVTVTCQQVSSCTAPQSLSVAAILGGHRVSFSGAAYPPPYNSYAVFRKVASAGDGTYVNLGAPTFNPSTNKWENIDNTASANTLYTYKAVSNCDVPKSVTVNFANITCPTLSLTVSSGTLGYSFTDIGGQVDKYDVEVWDSYGVTKIGTNTFTPAFTNPITGSFTGLTNGSTYKIRVVVYIGAESFNCSFTNRKVFILSPMQGSFIVENQGNAGSTIISLTPSTWFLYPVGTFPIAVDGSLVDYHEAYSGSLAIDCNVSVDSRVELYQNGVLVSCEGHVGTGAQTYNLTGLVIAALDSILIRLVAGDTCP